MLITRQYPVNDSLRELLQDLGIPSPTIRIDRKNRLIHIFSFDVDVVEETVKSLTDKYTVGDCVTPSYMRWIEFEDDADINAVVIALMLQFK